jgi:hypothetical protein
LKSRIIVRLVASALLCLCGTALASFDAGLAPFKLHFGEEPAEYHTMLYSVLPERTVPVAVPDPGNAVFELYADGGTLSRTGPYSWDWAAPAEPGYHALRVERNDGETVTLQVFVLRPREHAKNGMLNGYRVGEYPRRPLRDNPIYQAPDGFIEVPENMLDLPVSPHFTLGQFLCKQQSDSWPKYLALRGELLSKLEVLLAETNRRGIRTETFFIMSGFRTPAYNEAIGNVAYSRHVWGGAADIFIDNDGDGIMDDINDDGRHDIKDALVLHRIAVDLSENGIWRQLLGGLGLYGPRSHRGAFVHVDARGYKARWEVP